MSQYPNNPYQQHPYRPQQQTQYTAGGFPVRTQQPYPNYYAQYQPGGMPVTPTQSGLGVASFIVSVVCGLLFVGAFGVIIAAMSKSPTQDLPDDAPEAMTGGCMILAALGGAAVGCVLGLINFFQPDRKKLFGILGVVFNGGMLLLGGLLIVIGLASK
jgi:hypothetical protein